MFPNFESCGGLFLTEKVNETILGGMQVNLTNLVGKMVARENVRGGPSNPLPVWLKAASCTGYQIGSLRWG
ncbi:hypothetical protein [Ruegeria arenilitoris]|uniref:hypothetical protein n=1 Tax=Ruegeria arenilitoris TaxID=1173585 RepID=UPI00147C06F0|nr:hypothetical protein [Ruegeria arenilitoris]